jgi:hypothetical protein
MCAVQGRHRCFGSRLRGRKSYILLQTAPAHCGRRRLARESFCESVQLRAIESTGACVMPARAIKIYQCDAAVIVENDVPRFDVSVSHATEMNGL